MAVNPPEELELDGLTVRRLSPADADDLFAHFSDPQVTEFLDFSTLRSCDEAEAIINWATDLFEAARGIRWAIRASGSGAFIGTCGFNAIVRQHGSRGEIAYDLAREFWGRGLMRTVMPFRASALRTGVSWKMRSTSPSMRSSFSPALILLSLLVSAMPKGVTRQEKRSRQGSSGRAPA